MRSEAGVELVPAGTDVIALGEDRTSPQHLVHVTGGYRVERNRALATHTGGMSAA